jgi:tetratricopeptide (TPR) repeat protein
MGWGVNLEDLADARDRLRARAAEHPTSHVLEQLARAHAWLGEVEEARRRWREAAAVEEEHVHRWGREDPTRIARVGSLLLRAGDAEAARPWLERAVRAELRHDRLAALSYLLGGYDAAIGYAERAVADEGGPYPWVEAVAALARARRDGDAAAAEQARAGFAALIREERTPPDEESGSGDHSLFDWLAETYRAIGELPSGREMLERNGLLSAERASRRVCGFPRC